MNCDKEGNKIWEKTVGGPLQEWVGGVDILSNFIIIGGWTRSFGRGEKDIYMVCLNRNGEIMWEKTFGGKEMEDMSGMCLSNNKNVLLVGATKSFTHGDTDIYVIYLELRN